MNMKKILFFALFACATLAFVGCEPTPVDPIPDSTKVVITVTPDSLLLGIGDTEKLTATVTSENGVQVKVTWTSDNEDVVTVAASGIVLAAGAGTANVIASAEGAIADTCVITVTNDALYDQFALGGYGIFGKGEVLVADTLVPLSDGSTVRCEIANGTLIAWDENIVFVNGTGFAGDGFAIWQEVPMFWIIEGDDAGYYLGSANGFMVAVPEFEEGVEMDIVTYFMAPGELVDVQNYGDGWLAMLMASSEDEYRAALEIYQAAHTGTQLIEAEGGSFYYTAVGNVAYAQFDDVYNEVTNSYDIVYDLVVDWYDILSEDRFYGLAITTEENEDGELMLTGFVEPYDVRTIRKEYTNKSIDDAEPVQAPMWQPMKKNLYLNQTPTIGVKKTDMMYKK